MSSILISSSDRSAAPVADENVEDELPLLPTPVSAADVEELSAAVGPCLDGGGWAWGEDEGAKTDLGGKRLGVWE